MKVPFEVGNQAMSYISRSGAISCATTINVSSSKPHWITVDAPRWGERTSGRNLPRIKATLGRGNVHPNVLSVRQRKNARGARRWRIQICGASRLTEPRHRRLLKLRKARRVRGCHCNAVVGYTVPVDFDERHKFAVVAVIVLFVLQAEDRDPVAEVLCEKCVPEAERGTRLVTCTRRAFGLPMAIHAADHIITMISTWSFILICQGGFWVHLWQQEQGNGYGGRDGDSQRREVA